MFPIPGKRGALLALLGLHLSVVSCLQPRGGNGTCKKTKVAVLGAGMAGIAAAQALSNSSVTDFVVIDINDYIGGRVKHTTFGKNSSTGEPYVVELGANWVQGLGTPGGPENPIWTLAQKWGLVNTYSNYSLILTYDENGAVDYSSFLDGYEDSYSEVEQDAGTILTQNYQDRSMRVGLSVADWKPKKDMHQQASEWWEFDWEYSYSPDQSSETWAVVNYNTTFYQYSDENNYVFDQRGFNYFIQSEAYTFLEPNDTRLMLSTNITSIDYSSSKSVTITTSDGDCITADYAICTFSIGVLQNDIVDFTPPLPAWKQAGIEAMQMGTYTKIFLQFPPNDDGVFFWETEDPNTQFFLYADPVERGWYPVWQSLSAPGFIEGSGIFFATVVYSQSYRAENQADNITLAEVMIVLKSMYGAENVPDPLDFMYPRWSTESWTLGSYSNWPPGLGIETHQNLRANLGRLWFAGEATSAEYYGFLQGAYFEGQNAGEVIADCINGNKTQCKDETSYSVIRGCTTSDRMLTPKNGWTVSSMLDFGF